MNEQRDWRPKLPPRNTKGFIRIEDAEGKAMTAFFRGFVIGAGMTAWAIGVWVAL